MSEENKRRCYSCLYYSAYYTKAMCAFTRLDYGICSKTHISMQDKHGTCELWHGKYKGKKLRLRFAMNAVIHAAESLAVIRQILEESEIAAPMSDDNLKATSENADDGSTEDSAAV